LAQQEEHIEEPANSFQPPVLIATWFMVKKLDKQAAALAGSFPARDSV
jgi:hypothetical protein